jgi:hypothetical protein
MATIIIIESTIEASAEQLYPYFENVEKFGEIHPLIKSVMKLRDNLYLVSERINLIGNLGFINRYEVVVATSPYSKVDYKIQLPLGVSLAIDFTFTPLSPAQTIIKETIVIKGFFPARFILGVMIKKYHHQILDELKARYSFKK